MSTAEADAKAVRPFLRAPEPAFFWVRYAPRNWPPAERPWYDLARGGLGARPGDRGAANPVLPLTELEGAPFDDTVWLPPVPLARDDERRRFATGWVEQGAPVLMQLHPGDRTAPEGVTVLYDLTPVFVEGDAAAGMADLPSGSAVLWPLIPGISDSPALWHEGCAALAAAGVAVVQGAVPSLTPADRRRLADGLGENAYRRLFHAGPAANGPGGVDEAAFARAAAAAGLEVFLPRPLPTPPATGRAARHVAGALFLVAELWLRLDRPPSQGQAFFRAGRWVDESTYDPEALVREGNLGVVEVLDEASRVLIEDTVARAGRPALLDELLAEYTGRDDSA